MLEATTSSFAGSLPSSSERSSSSALHLEVKEGIFFIFFFVFQDYFFCYVSLFFVIIFMWVFVHWDCKFNIVCFFELKNVKDWCFFGQ